MNDKNKSVNELDALVAGAKQAQADAPENETQSTSSRDTTELVDDLVVDRVEERSEDKPAAMRTSFPTVKRISRYLLAVLVVGFAGWMGVSYMLSQDEAGATYVGASQHDAAPIVETIEADPAAEVVEISEAVPDVVETISDLDLPEGFGESDYADPFVTIDADDTDEVVETNFARVEISAEELTAPILMSEAYTETELALARKAIALQNAYQEERAQRRLLEAKLDEETARFRDAVAAKKRLEAELDQIGTENKTLRTQYSKTVKERASVESRPDVIVQGIGLAADSCDRCADYAIIYFNEQQMTLKDGDLLNGYQVEVNGNYIRLFDDLSSHSYFPVN